MYNQVDVAYKFLLIFSSISEQPNGTNGIYYTVQDDSYQIQLKLDNIRKEKLKLGMFICFDLLLKS